MTNREITYNFVVISCSQSHEQRAFNLWKKNDPTREKVKNEYRKEAKRPTTATHWNESNGKSILNYTMNGKFVRDYVYVLTEKAVLCKENDGQYSMSTIFTRSRALLLHVYLYG